MESTLAHLLRQLQQDVNRHMNDLDSRLRVTKSELKEAKRLLQWHSQLWAYVGEGCCLLAAYAVVAIIIGCLIYWHLFP